MVMQTIGHKHGHINVTDNTIAAWCHGKCLGDHYSTIAAAKGAITKAHKQWVNERTTDHHKFMQETFR